MKWPHNEVNWIVSIYAGTWSLGANETTPESKSLVMSVATAPISNLVQNALTLTKDQF